MDRVTQNIEESFLEFPLVKSKVFKPHLTKKVLYGLLSTHKLLGSRQLKSYTYNFTKDYLEIENFKWVIYSETWSDFFSIIVNNVEMLYSVNFFKKNTQFVIDNYSELIQLNLSMLFTFYPIIAERSKSKMERLIFAIQNYKVIQNLSLEKIQNLKEEDYIHLFFITTRTGLYSLDQCNLTKATGYTLNKKHITQLNGDVNVSYVKTVVTEIVPLRPEQKKQKVVLPKTQTWSIYLNNFISKGQRQYFEDSLKEKQTHAQAAQFLQFQNEKKNLDNYCAKGLYFCSTF